MSIKIVIKHSFHPSNSWPTRRQSHSGSRGLPSPWLKNSDQSKNRAGSIWGDSSECRVWSPVWGSLCTGDTIRRFAGRRRTVGIGTNPVTGVSVSDCRFTSNVYEEKKRWTEKGANKGFTLHLSLRISCWRISIFIIFCNRGPSLFKSSFPKLRLSSSSSFKFLYNELHFKFIIFLFTTFTKKKQIKISKRFYASSRFIFFL